MRGLAGSMASGRLQGRVRTTVACLAAALALIAASAPGTAQAGMCAIPGAGGCSSGPAVAAQAVGPSGFAGNPVHLATGNKYQREVDVASVPGGLSLEMVRHYNSRTAYRGLFGFGWRMSYEAVAFASAASIQIVQADGRRIVFDRDPRSPGACATRFVEDGVLHEDAHGISWDWPDGHRLRFASSGRLERIDDPDGQSVSLDYDPKGHLLQVTDRQGQRLRFDLVADSSGRRMLIAAVQAPQGRWRYVYDRLDRLVEVVPPDLPGAVVRRYLYEDAATGGDPYNLTGISLSRVGEPASKALRVSSWRYDARDRVAESGSATTGDHLEFDYDGEAPRDSHVTRVVRDDGRSSRYRFATVGGVERLVESTGPGCTTCPDSPRVWRYDEHGQLALEQRLDDRGQPIVARRLRRDERQRVIEVDELRYVAGRVAIDQWVERRAYRDAVSLLPSRISVPSAVAGQEHSLVFEWTAQGQPASIVEHGWTPDAEALVQLARDSERARAGVTLSRGVERLRSVGFRHEQRGGITRLVAVDGPLGGDDDAVRLSFDRAGRIERRVDAGGLVTQTLAFDLAGRPTRWRRADGVLVERDYDLSGRLLREQVGSAETWIERDLLGRMSVLSLPGGARYRFMRDARGAVTRVDGPDDARIVVTRDALGRPVTLVVEDADGKALFGPLRLDRDSDDRVARVIESASDVVNLDLAYDPAGRLATIKDALGRAVALGRDSSGVVQSVDRRNTSGATFDAGRWQHDESGHVRVHRDAMGRVAVQVTDDFGNRVLETHPDSGARLMRYDAAGRLEAMIDSAGRSLSITRDAAGRAIALGAVGEPARVQLQWRGAQLISVTEPLQRLGFGYDDRGRRSSETRELRAGSRWLRFDTRYAFDEADRVVRTILPDGHRLESSYTAAGRLAAIRFDDAPLLRHIGWRGFDLGVEAGLGRMTHGNGTSSVIEYDDHARPVRLQASDHRLELDRDRIGRIVASSENGSAQAFRYDDHDRLVSASRDGQAFGWRYDAIGNRVGDSSTGHERRIAVPSTRALPLAAGNDLRIASESGGSIVAAWSGIDMTAYAFNQAGERIERWSPSEQTVFLHCNGQLVAEADGAGRIRRHYVWLGHRPVAVVDIDAAGVSHVAAIDADHRGAPTRATDERGRVVWAARYEPFGKARIEGDLRLDLRLPGQSFDVESGLHHQLHRDYDPDLGRYVQSDPAGWRGGINGYAYVSNDPLNRVDPTGLYESDVHFYLTYFLAVTSGVSAEDARVIALASQYIDDNPLTAPITLDADGKPDYKDTALNRNQALRSYHFVLSDAATGRIPPALKNGNIYEPRSSQLESLYTAVLTSEKDAVAGTADCDADLQLFGEFLHAFSDTFAHRDRDDIPYDAGFQVMGAGFGVGHFTDGHNPDVTYDHWSTLGAIDPLDAKYIRGVTKRWGTNEARTIEMAREVKAEMAPFSRATGKSVPWTLLQPWVAKFSAVRGDEEDGIDQMPAKIAVLEAALKSFGYPLDIAWSGNKTGVDSYDLAEAARNRREMLKRLDPAKYPGVMFDPPKK